MNQINSSQEPKPKQGTMNNDEIDLREILKAILRRKNLVFKISAISLIISLIHAFTQKPVWEGEFQIVLEEKNSQAGKLAQLAATNPMLANIAGLGGNNSSSLKTEVKILESPSVLKPVYNFVRSQKLKAGENVNNYTFSDWLPNLKVELEKGTSVLTITYQDTDKELVLPVIQKISETYQSYSGRDRSRGLSQGLKYLEEQLGKMREQANDSMRTAQAFALSNGLGLQDGMSAEMTSNAGPGSTGSVETNRELAQNKVNDLRQQLAAAKADDTSGIYVAPQLKATTDLYAKLQELQADLDIRTSLLRPSDPSIQNLRREIHSLKNVINQQTIRLLEGKLQTALAQLTSLTRPREVVLKHRELVRNALRDEKILTELENQLQTLRLEKSRQTDPWQLISIPTLFDKPVAPQKKRIIALGLFAGIVLGSAVSLVKDRRTGLVYSTDELKKLLPYPLLKQLPAWHSESWVDAADLLAIGPLSTSSEPSAVALIPLGAITSDQLKAFSTELRRVLNNRELLISTDLRKTSLCATQLLLLSRGTATRTQISDFCQKLVLQGTPVAGYVLLDPELNLE